jgi:hypothetical protein
MDDKPLAVLDAHEAAALERAAGADAPTHQRTNAPYSDHPVRTPAPAGLTPQSARVSPDPDPAELDEHAKGHAERMAGRFVGPGNGEFRDARLKLPHQRIVHAPAPRLRARAAAESAAEGTETNDKEADHGTGRR